MKKRDFIFQLAFMVLAWVIMLLGVACHDLSKENVITALISNTTLLTIMIGVNMLYIPVVRRYWVIKIGGYLYFLDYTIKSGEEIFPVLTTTSTGAKRFYKRKHAVKMAKYLEDHLYPGGKVFIEKKWGS